MSFENAGHGKLKVLLSCPVFGMVSSTINGTVTDPTTGTGSTIHMHTT
jgi:hypothetical protein